MKKRNLSVTLWLIVSFTLGLVLCLQQGYASDQREEEKTFQSQHLSKIQEPKFKASYGDFDVLSEDILFHQLLPRCDRTIIQVNRSFFTLVTGYESNHIFDQSFESKPTKPICCLQSHIIFYFEKHLHHIEQMPSFVWYSLIREVKDVPPSYWSYLKGSLIHTVILYYNQIGNDGARDFGQSLKGTQVQSVDLSDNDISDDGTWYLIQALRETQVQTLDLSWNRITKNIQITLRQLLPNVNIRF